MDAPPLALQKQRWCAHRSVRLEPTARRVYCRACEREVDPFTALEAFARDYDRHTAAIEMLSREEQQRRAGVEELKRERANLQAQVKRLRSKLP
jgi:hypothetical protein